jgi:hypothetical protein
MMLIIASFQNARTNQENRPYAISQDARVVHGVKITLRLQWVPGCCEHCDSLETTQLAKDAACIGKTEPFRPLLTKGERKCAVTSSPSEARMEIIHQSWSFAEDR